MRECKQSNALSNKPRANLLTPKETVIQVETWTLKLLATFGSQKN